MLRSGNVSGALTLSRFSSNLSPIMMLVKCSNEVCHREGTAELGVALLGVVCPVCNSAMSIVRQPPLSFGWSETLAVGLIALAVWGILSGPKKGRRRS